MRIKERLAFVFHWIGMFFFGIIACGSLIKGDYAIGAVSVFLGALIISMPEVCKKGYKKRFGRFLLLRW